jgi:hypothetical protein
MHDLFSKASGLTRCDWIRNRSCNRFKQKGAKAAKT